MTRRIAVAFIVLTVLLFAFGWIFVANNTVSSTMYLAVTGVAGSIASFLGLYGLVRPSFSRRDVDGATIEALAEMAKTEKDLAELGTRRAAVNSELEQLSRTREELAELVKKAALVLFLREEQDRRAERVLEFLTEHASFRRDLEGYNETQERLKGLSSEVREHPDVQLINDVVARARKRSFIVRREFHSAAENVPLFGPFFKLVIVMVDVYIRAFQVIFKRSR